MKNIKFLLILSLAIFCKHSISQTIDTGKYENTSIGFYYNTILKEVYKDSLNSPKKFVPENEFIMDFQNKTFPTNIREYNITYHSLPVSQGSSGTCWSYAASSFMESEAFRKTNIKVKLSEIFVAYWEYIDRAINFVASKGDIHIGQGSESNAILKVMKNHGLVPFSIYNGLKEGQNYNNHNGLFSEFNSYLKYIKEKEIWDKEIVLDSVKQLLDKHIGTPANEFIYKGNTYTAKSFMSDYLNLDPEDYSSFISTKELTYNEQHELIVNDNWWHSKDYYNLPLNDYMELVNSAISSGYSISMCGDVTEPGYNKLVEVAVIPSFDIPSEYINADARELRLTNKTTTDDHCIHIVGYKKADDGKYWYLIKDSGSGAYDGPNKGYRFYHEDYIKLKIINIMVHKDIAKPYLPQNQK